MVALSQVNEYFSFHAMAPSLPSGGYLMPLTVLLSVPAVARAVVVNHGATPYRPLGPSGSGLPAHIMQDPRSSRGPGTLFLALGTSTGLCRAYYRIRHTLLTCVTRLPAGSLGQPGEIYPWEMYRWHIQSTTTG